MKFDSIIEERRSVRSFKNKVVDFRDIMAAVDSALQGPFAGNINDMKFIIIEDEKSIEKIARHASQIWIGEAPAIVVVCSNEKHLEELYGERGRVYSRQQAGAAIENLLLKITDLGLSACWVGAFSDEEIKRDLQIPSSTQIEAIIPIGYEKKGPASKKPRKKELSGNIFWDIWGKKKRPTIFEEGKPDTPAY